MLNLYVMKKTLSLLAITFILVLGLYSLTGASFFNAKNAMNTDNLKKVCISTSYGDIKIKLYDQTPQHRDNFIKLAKEAYFDGTIFHRIIKNFMIQGGDPDSKTADSSAILGNGGPKYTIPAEILFDTITENLAAGTKRVEVLKYIHKKGVVAAARDNNPSKASSGSQFYIVQGKVSTDAELKMLEANFNATKRNKHITDYLLKPENINMKNEVVKYQTEKNKTKLDSIIKIVGSIVDAKYTNEPNFEYTADQIKIYTTIGGTPHLDGNYTVFGEVYEGLDVVDKIAGVQCGANDRPKKDVKMTVKVIE
jgi:cyclophilin family peptidyl-prolyl cis-trans isomerase